MDGTIELNWKVVMRQPSQKEVASNAAAGIGGITVGCIAMDVKYHVGDTEANDCVWMGGKVVQHLVDREVGLWGSLCLFMGNSSQCHYESNVDAMCIVENLTDDLLDSGDTLLVKTWRLINQEWEVSIFSICFWNAVIWAVL